MSKEAKEAVLLFLCISLIILFTISFCCGLKIVGNYFSAKEKVMLKNEGIEEVQTCK